MRTIVSKIVREEEELSEARAAGCSRTPAGRLVPGTKREASIAVNRAAGRKNLV